MAEYKLSETELYIMERFWTHGAMKSDELAAQVAEKGWKATTLLTFLSRLAAKGMLRVDKAGKSNLYSPCVSREAYAQSESQALLNTLYDGSARNFLAALVEGGSLNEGQVVELKSWFDGLEVKDDE